MSLLWRTTGIQGVAGCRLAMAPRAGDVCKLPSGLWRGNTCKPALHQGVHGGAFHWMPPGVQRAVVCGYLQGMLLQVVSCMACPRLRCERQRALGEGGFVAAWPRFFAFPGLAR